MSLLASIIIKFVSALKAGMPEQTADCYVYPFLGGSFDKAIEGFVEESLAKWGKSDESGGIDFNPARIEMGVAEDGLNYAADDSTAAAWAKLSGFFTGYREYKKKQVLGDFLN